MEFSSFNTYLRLAILCFGIPGNIFTILVISRQKFRFLNIRILFIALAVSDTLVLLITNGLVTISSLTGKSEEIFNTDIYCRFGNFLNFYLPQRSSYILVCIAVERMIAVVYPHKVKLVFIIIFYFLECWQDISLFNVFIQKWFNLVFLSERYSVSGSGNGLFLMLFLICFCFLSYTRKSS